jgi:outer membrane usher protein
MGKALNLFCCLLLVSLAPVAAFADWVPLRLVIDKVFVGDINVDLPKKGEVVAVRGSQVVNMLSPYLQSDKVSRIRAQIKPDDVLALSDLARVGITSEFNEKELLITMTIPLEMRSVKDFPVILARNQTGVPVNDGFYSGYLNLYGLVGYTTIDTPAIYNNQKNPVEGQLELVQNFRYFTFESTGLYREFSDPDNPFHRVDSSLVHDLESSQVRLRAGDFYTGVQGFQAGLSAAGLQIQKQFNIFPDKGSISKRSTIIQVKSNSLLEVYVNDNLITRVRVPTGPYNLKELPLIYGRNKLRVILRDDFGGKEEFEVDMLYDDQILAEGVHDFNYQSGRPSYLVGYEKQYYEDIFTSFYHKYGLTDNVTVSLNHQNYLSSNLFGAGAGFLTNYGTHFFDLAYYTDNIESGAHAGRWRYNSPHTRWQYFDKFRVLLAAESQGDGFASITPTIALASTIREKYDAVLQKQLTDTSSFSVAATKQLGQGPGGVDEMSRRLAYQNQFARNWRFDLLYSWTDARPNEDHILVTLNWFEQEGRAQAAFAHDTNNDTTSMRVNRNSRFNYNDLQLSAYAAKQTPPVSTPNPVVDAQNVDLSANYYATNYEARLQLAGATNGSTFNNSSQLGLGTALAWTTNSIGFSRPIRDAFAVVSPEGMTKSQELSIPNGLEKDQIRLKNNSDFIFANLTSYVESSLKLDSTGLGASAHLDREAYILTPRYRQGLYVPLKVIKSLTVRGRLNFDKKEKVSYAYGRVLTEDGKVFSDNFFTDESGIFVLDGLSYGKYVIELADPRYKTITFELTERAKSDDEDTETEDPDASVYEMGTLKIEKKAGT